ncbi:MAG: peptidylprolyl isomerase [Parvularculaceae bacterium]
MAVSRTAAFMAGSRRAAGLAGRYSLIALRALGKFIATVWRLAGALDSALWRGVKLAGVSIFGFVAATVRAAAGAIRDVFRWLPSRSGRAYAAASGVVLIFASLWIVDEIRGARVEAGTREENFRPPADAVDPIVARLEGRFVHLSDIDAFARAGGQLRDREKLTVSAAFERELVKAYVEQRLLARAAIKDGLQREPAVVRRLGAARDRILASSYMETRINDAVTPEQIKKLYDSQASIANLGDEVKARHILVATREEADAIVAELKGGANFGAIARARSLDRATAPLGGEIGWFTRDMMAPTLSRAAFATPKGEIAEPFQSEFGWHVLEIEDRRATSGIPFASVEGRIRRFLTLREINRAVDELTDESGVTYYPPKPTIRTGG